MLTASRAPTACTTPSATGDHRPALPRPHFDRPPQQPPSDQRRRAGRATVDLPASRRTLGVLVEIPPCPRVATRCRTSGSATTQPPASQPAGWVELTDHHR